MQRIAFITAFPPNKKSAGQNVTLTLLRSLSKKFNIDVYVIDHRKDDAEFLDLNIRLFNLKVSKFERILNTMFLFFLHPLFTNRFNIFKALKLRRLVQSYDYDVVIFNFSQVFLYSLFVPSKKKIYIVHDVIYQLFERKKIPIIRKLVSIFTFWSEKLILKLAKREIVVLNYKDNQLIKNLYTLESHVGKVLLDDAILALNYNNLEIENSIVLFASWKRNENKEMFLYFFEKIYPKLDKSIKVYILGSGISEEMEKYLIGKENVVKVGFVDNPYIYIAKSKILFAVLFKGAGIKIKVLESFACGTYVIGNEITFEGIDFSKGRIFTKDEEDCVNKIKEFMSKISLHDKLELRNSFLKYYETTIKLDLLIENLIYKDSL